MTNRGDPVYIMESKTEGSRLEKKTDPVETERQLRLVGLKPGMKALDAGAGTGAVARVMAKLVGSRGEVVAFDASESRLQQGEKLADAAGLKNIFFKSGDILSPPFPSESFDFVWCRFVFEYLSDPDTAMDKLANLVLPGGTLVISDLDGNAIFHDGMDSELEETLHKVLNSFQDNFDPYAGRKLYRRFFQRGFKDIQVHCLPYNLYAGTIPEDHLSNWEDKFKSVRSHAIKELGSSKRYEQFVEHFIAFLKSPETFTYSTLFLVSGVKP